MRNLNLLPSVDLVRLSTDAVLMQETWQEQSVGEASSIFKGYVSTESLAFRQADRGTASGGLANYYRADVFEVKETWKARCYLADLVRLRDTGALWLIVNVYVNAQQNEETINEIFTLIQTTQEERNPTGVIVAGDWNGRIGDEGEFPLEDSVGDVRARRKSQDKFINTRGRMILNAAEDSGLVIINGRLQPDIPGNFTCTSQNGSSVIDLAMVGWNFVPICKTLEFDELGSSDHCRGCLSLEIMNNEQSSINERPRLAWKEDKKQEYVLATAESFKRYDTEAGYASFTSLLTCAATRCGLIR